MNIDLYKALYIHIPFCVSKCFYCDFCSRVRDKDGIEVEEYVDRLILDIREKAKQNLLSEIETIYIGGGTPTYIGAKNLTKLLYAISLSINLEQVKEFTIEANPESINSSLIKDIYALGVNRISLGVQSFNDDILKMLGRAHSSKEALDAIEVIKSRFENISIDLICGIPGQTLEDFNKSMNCAIKLDIPHLSIYPLSIERNTVFYKWLLQGKIDDTDDDVQAEHMELAAKILKEHGYIHYEVASYAKKGFESKHNLSYWQSKPYLGIGESATTMTQSAEKRMRMTDNNVEDCLNKTEMILEDIMLSMRCAKGCSMDLYNKAYLLNPNIEKTFNKLISLDLIKKQDNAFVPTKKGWLCGNDLYSKILEI